MLCHLSFRRPSTYRALIVLGIFVHAGPGSFGGSIPFYIDTSNVLSAPPTGRHYASVTLTQIATNTVEFTISADSTVYKSTGANFGVASFAFNSTISLVSSDIKFKTPTTGWKSTQNGTGDGFGNFSWVVSSTLARGSNPLVFDITHTGAVVSDFENLNIHNALFAAQIVNFTSSTGVTSQWAANKGGVIPEPSSLVMGSIGALGLLGGIIRSRYKRRTFTPAL